MPIVGFLGCTMATNDLFIWDKNLGKGDTWLVLLGDLYTVDHGTTVWGPLQ